MLKEVIIVLALAGAFFDLSMLSPFTDKALLNSPYVAVAAIVNISLLISLAVQFKSLKKGEMPKSFISGFTASLPIVSALLIIGILRLPFNDCPPRWDAWEYFHYVIKAVRCFDFTVRGFIEQFNFCGHPMHGYGTIAALSQFMDPGNHINLNRCNFLLLCLSAYFMFRILKCFFGAGMTDIELAFGSLLFALHPLYFSSSIHFTPDFGLTVFFAGMIYSLVCNRQILYVLFASLMIFSKEPGLILYLTSASFYIAGLLFYDNCGLKCRLKKTIKKSTALLVPGLLFALIFLSSKFSLWSGNNSNIFRWENSGFQCFGISPFQSSYFLKTFLILDFSWLLALAIIILAIKFRKNFFSSMTKSYLPIAGACIGFFVFNLIFQVGAVIPRYIQVGAFFLAFFFMHALSHIREKWVRIALLSAGIILFSIQLYSAFDPVTNMVFGTYRFGNNKMVNTTSNAFTNRCDGMVYNCQYTNIDRLYDKALSGRISIRQETNIILNTFGDNYFFNWWLPMLQAYPVDSAFNTRSLKSNGYYLNAYYISQISANSAPDKAVCIYSPWLDNGDGQLEKIFALYEVLSTEVLSYNGYSITLYDLAIKDNSRSLSAPASNRFQLGQMLFIYGLYRDSIRAYKNALAFSPNDKSALNNIGYDYYLLNEPFQAEQYFMEALKTDPGFDLAKNNLAMVTGKALKKKSGEESSLIEQSMDAYRKKNYAECIAYCKKALQINPNSVIAYNNIGSAYNELEQWDKAVQALEKAVELSPDFTLAKNNLAWARKHLAIKK